MALIKCPACGKDISDKAEVCPHCGWEKKEKIIMFCEECGKELEVDATVCKECGCPVIKKVETENLLQKVTIENSPINKMKNRKIIITIIVVLALVLVVSFFVKISKNNVILKEKADYENNLTVITMEMLNGAAEAEDVGNLIKAVWYNTIYEESDSETDLYTKNKYGSFNDDFNDSLSNLFSDSVFQSQISVIEGSRETVKELMKELQNPSEEHREAYEAAKDFYDSYLELTELVINPQGNLQTFSNNFSEADSDVVNKYETMQLYLE